MEEVIQVGCTKYTEWNRQQYRVYSTKGLAPCLNTVGGGNLEPKILTARTICMNSKVNGKQPSLEHRVYDSEGIATAVTTGFHPSIAEPKIVQKFGDRGTDQYSVRDIAHTIPANPMSDRGQMLLEPKIRQMGRGFNKGNLHNICPTITSNSFECNNFVINYIPFIPKTIDVRRLRIELYAKRNNIKNYRIRKLTPRECFRLMGVDDKDIDKIQLYPFGEDIQYPSYSYKERLANMTEEEKRKLMRQGISNSQQYKMAGNSIVVDNLYHIFRTLFVDKPTKQVKQLTLF